MKNKQAAAQVTWTLVTRPQDVVHVTSKKALLIGPTVFASGNDIVIPGYTKLPSRPGVGVIGSLIAKHPARVHVGLHSVVMSTAPRGVRFALAVDAYIQWGIRSKGKVILIGGFDDASESVLDILVFDNGRFLEYSNRVLPGTSANHYTETVADLLDDLSAGHPDYKIVQAAPLTPLGKSFPNVQYVGEKLFKRVTFRPLAQTSKARRHRITLPVGMVALAALFYVGAVGKGWSDFRSAKETFLQEIADPLVQGKGGVDSTLIDVTQQRRFFMDAPRRQEAMVEKSRALVTGIGRIDGVRIVEVTLATPGADNEASEHIPGTENGNSRVEAKPDVLLKISVPNSGAGAMEQGKEVMQAIAANTGMSVKLARQGWSDAGKRRIFSIEGYING